MKRGHPAFRKRGTLTQKQYEELFREVLGAPADPVRDAEARERSARFIAELDEVKPR